MKKPALLFILITFLLSSSLKAEYRAYLLEVYDHILKKQWEERTGFSPDKYVLTHGGGNRLSVYVKATWVCYGDTSEFQPACAMPAPVKPKFKEGDWVRINLEKHITEGWVGQIELAYYQADVKSNVYGVRFGQKRKLYNRYFEFNLDKSEQPVAPPDAGAPTETENQNEPAQ